MQRLMRPGLVVGLPVSDFLQTFLDLYASIGYWALFLGVLLENAGLPLPGETALLVASYLASPEGGGKLSLWAVAFVAFVAAVVGDNTGYWLGRLLARRRLERGQRFLFLTPARFLRAERYFARFGSATVFFGRFVALLRIAAGPAAGAAGMPWYRFVVANVAGAALWVGTISFIGYYAGAAWEAAQRWLGRGAWAAAGAVVLAWAVHRLLVWRRTRAAGARIETALPAGEWPPEVGDAAGCEKK
jgi:membrane protein DedA with SNARE-associated domain